MINGVDETPLGNIESRMRALYGNSAAQKTPETEKPPLQQKKTQSIAREAAPQLAGNSIRPENIQQPGLLFRGLQFEKCPGDGDCLFHAIALHLSQDAPSLRQIAANSIEANPDKYSPFIGDSAETFRHYIKQLRTTQQWGGEPEIVALQTFSGRPIVILRSDRNPTTFGDIDEDSTTPIFIYYNGINHYDTFTLKDGFDARAILEAIKQKKTVKYDPPTQFVEHSPSLTTSTTKCAPPPQSNSKKQGGEYHELQNPEYVNLCSAISENNRTSIRNITPNNITFEVLNTKNKDGELPHEIAYSKGYIVIAPIIEALYWYLAIRENKKGILAQLKLEDLCDRLKSPHLLPDNNTWLHVAVSANNTRLVRELAECKPEWRTTTNKYGKFPESLAKKSGQEISLYFLRHQEFHLTQSPKAPPAEVELPQPLLAIPKQEVLSSSIKQDEAKEDDLTKLPLNVASLAARFEPAKSVPEPAPAIETIEASEPAPAIETIEASEPAPAIETIEASEPAPAIKAIGALEPELITRDILLALREKNRASLEIFIKKKSIPLEEPYVHDLFLAIERTTGKILDDITGYLEERLHDAASTGDFLLVKRLLIHDHFLDINIRLGERKETIFEAAFFQNNFTIAQLLADKDAYINPTKDKRFLLTIALDNTAPNDPEQRKSRTNLISILEEKTYIHETIELDDPRAFDYLINTMTVDEINENFFQGNNPLHVAVASGRLAMVGTLLSKGANPFIENANKETAFQIAHRNRTNIITESLTLHCYTKALKENLPLSLGILEFSHLTIDFNRFKQDFKTSITPERASIVKILLQRKTFILRFAGATAEGLEQILLDGVISAMEGQFKEVVQAFIDTKSANYERIILLAAERKNIFLLNECLRQKDRPIDFTITCDPTKQTALHHAARNNAHHMVQTLLANHAKASACDASDTTPARIAAREEHWDLAKKLAFEEAIEAISRGNDKQDERAVSRFIFNLFTAFRMPLYFSCDNHEHRTLFDYAKEYNIKSIIAAFEKKFFEAVASEDRKTFSTLRNIGVDKNTTNMYGNNALHESIMHEQFCFSMYLCFIGVEHEEVGSIPNLLPLGQALAKRERLGENLALTRLIKSLGQKTFLQNAIIAGDYSAFRYILNDTSIQETNTDLSLSRRMTALQRAVENNRPRMVADLLDHGADPLVGAFYNPAHNAYRLITAMIDPKIKNDKRELRACLLIHAVRQYLSPNKSIIQLLHLNREKDFELPNIPRYTEDKFTAFKFAILLGHKDWIIFFLEELKTKIQPDVFEEAQQHQYKLTADTFACLKNRFIQTNTLKLRRYLYEKNFASFEFFLDTIESEHIDFRFRVQNQNQNSNTLLHEILESNHLESFALTVNKITESRDFEALTHVNSKGRTILYEAALQNKTWHMSFLLKVPELDLRNPITSINKTDRRSASKNLRDFCKTQEGEYYKEKFAFFDQQIRKRSSSSSSSSSVSESTKVEMRNLFFATAARINQEDRARTVEENLTLQLQH